VYYPILINLTYFSFTVAVDNLLYFLKGCILSNIEWGSYHPTLVDDRERIRLSESEEPNQASLASPRMSKKLEKTFSFGAR